jgi:hypothetical protein
VELACSIVPLCVPTISRTLVLYPTRGPRGMKRATRNG